MKRRDAITHVSLLLGGTILGAEAFLSGCTNPPEQKLGGMGTNFSNSDVAFLDEVAETILPKTDTPGAKDAGVGQFMTVIVRDCYTQPDQKVFLDGMQKLDDASKKKNGKAFLDSTPEQRHDLLVDLDKESKEYAKTKKKDEPQHYFRMMKELTLWGYFTSKEGATEALVYVPVPGRYEGCIDLKKGQKAWAT
ncbi:MAG TPA: gluconate 2-dehydrogenase subunit 3 family protein [Puia sp.]|nr:gluconate 2-dehydrogenase subunit 3 family protein [Puia sp.]